MPSNLRIDLPQLPIFNEYCWSYRLCGIQIQRLEHRREIPDSKAGQGNRSNEMRLMVPAWAKQLLPDR
jgi:hypothetical protein